MLPDFRLRKWKSLQSLQGRGGWIGIQCHLKAYVGLASAVCVIYNKKEKLRNCFPNGHMRTNKNLVFSIKFINYIVYTSCDFGPEKMFCPSHVTMNSFVGSKQNQIP